MFYCPNCSRKTAVWQCDYDAEDLGYDKAGIVSMFSCDHCGADIEVTVFEDEEENEDIFEDNEDDYSLH